MRPDRGFTLIEMMVAIVVASLVLLVASRVHAALVDSGRAVAERRAAIDRTANARRLVGDLLAGVAIGTPDSRFEGGASRVVFTAWWTDQRGAWRRDRCVLALTSGALMLRIGHEPDLILADSVTAGGIEYLPEMDARAAWLRGFESELLTPVAVRLRVERAGRADTMVLMIGSR